MYKKDSCKLVSMYIIICRGYCICGNTFLKSILLEVKHIMFVYEAGNNKIK